MRSHSGVNFIVKTLLVAGLMTGCASYPASNGYRSQHEMKNNKPPAEYRIQPGDELEVKFFYNPELNQAQTVRPDGRISLMLLDDVKAAGLTPRELDDQLTRSYSAELKKPAVTIIVKSFSGQRVYVGGEVGRQGLIRFTPGMTPLEAVFDAGGFTEAAKPADAIVIRKKPGEEPVFTRIDLKKALYGDGESANFRLEPYDIVYVPKSGIAKANKFVRQYIQDLFLFRGVGLGFSWELHDAGPNTFN